jgi:hypothetical protein
MKLGQRMIRVEDGMKGVVAQNGPELRILYVDRGEERMALKSERWVPDEIRPGPLRLEEKATIAWYADRALRAYERNEPFKVWEKPNIDEPIYDEGLTRLIIEYLTARETLPAEMN